MRIHNCHPVATLKEITPCLSVSYSLYELPTTGLACRVFGDFLAAFWARSVPPQPPPLPGGEMVALRRVRV